jgi:hypothetical protein
MASGAIDGRDRCRPFGLQQHPARIEQAPDGLSGPADRPRNTSGSMDAHGKNGENITTAARQGVPARRRPRESGRRDSPHRLISRDLPCAASPLGPISVIQNASVNFQHFDKKPSSRLPDPSEASCAVDDNGSQLVESAGRESSRCTINGSHIRPRRREQRRRRTQTSDPGLRSQLQRNLVSE